MSTKRGNVTKGETKEFRILAVHNVHRISSKRLNFVFRFRSIFDQNFNFDFTLLFTTNKKDEKALVVILSKIEKIEKLTELIHQIRPDVGQH